MSATPGFVPPPYPYDRLDELKGIANSHDGGLVDLSIGTPFDPPPDSVLAALAGSGTERTYPPSIGTPAFREAAAGWLNRLVGSNVGPDDVRATIGSKEFVAGLPHWLKLRSPDLDTVLYPAISYPSYEMGATLAGCRAVPVPVDAQWRLDLSAIDPADAARALCLWVNTPGNPAGGLDDLAAAHRWGQDNDVLVVSDECYVAFTWQGAPQSIVRHGLTVCSPCTRCRNARTWRAPAPVSTLETRTSCTTSVSSESMPGSCSRDRFRLQPLPPLATTPTWCSSGRSTTVVSN